MVSAPPGASYLAERERLGMPSQPGPRTRTCPWCGADPGYPCQVRATSKLLPQVHEARKLAA
jgi:hypothetical protein